MSPRIFIAIRLHTAWFLSALLLLAGMLQAVGTMAAPVGTVTDVSGPLVARKADGTVLALSQKSAVDAGDVLESEKKTYARIRFIDNSEIVLKPGTQFKIESFSFDEARPADDSSVFSLIKGGLRSITGLLGKRNKEKYQLHTAAATIGIRGTDFGALFCKDDCTNLQTNGSTPLRNGLYLDVKQGVINASNQAGSQDYQVGQFGYVADEHTVPIIIAQDQGWTLPDGSILIGVGDAGAGGGGGNSDGVGGVGGGGGGSGSGAKTSKPGSVDCEVR